MKETYKTILTELNNKNSIHTRAKNDRVLIVDGT